MMFSHRFSLFIMACVGGVFFSPPAHTQTADGAVPQSIQDLTALLEQERPDLEKIAQLNAAAAAEVPASLTGAARGEAFFRRAEARVQIGRLKEGIEDAKEALKFTKGLDYATVTSHYEEFLQRRMRAMGDFRSAIPIIQSMMRNLQFSKNRFRLFPLEMNAVLYYAGLGDLDRADQYLRSLRALLAESRGWTVTDGGRAFASNVDEAQAVVDEVRGRLPEAEARYRRSAAEMRDSLSYYEAMAERNGKFFNFRYDFESVISAMEIGEARMKLAQGRTVEAEVEIRQVLLDRLKRLGRDHEDIGGTLAALAAALIAEGRNVEAEQVARIGSDIFGKVGFPPESNRAVVNKLLLARALGLLGRGEEAAKLYDEIDRDTAKWEPAVRTAVVNETGRMALLINSGRAEEAIALAQDKLRRERARSGDSSVATAVVRGYLAAAFVAAARDAEAAGEFKAAIPVLLARRDDRDDAIATGAIIGQNRFIAERYMVLLARNPALVGDAGAETFGLADHLRNRSVQRALAQASARWAAKDPALGALARSEQDLRKQTADALESLNALLALPSAERDAKAVNDAQLRIAKLRAQHGTKERDLAKRFPAYANLLNPPPATPADVRAVLTDDETFLSFYFGDSASFVWALPKSGPLQFVKLDLTLSGLDDIVSKLREALDPEVTSIADMPPFDLAVAHQLYELVLKPVEASWKPAHNIVMTTNGAMGMLPLGVLPVAPAEVDVAAEPPFSGYRGITWLARTHAVTVVPSSTSLLALRKPGGAAPRDKLIGFGDPIFKMADPKAAPAAAATAPAEVAPDELPPETRADPSLTRGIALERRAAPAPGDIGAPLWRLPRLPETADELRSIAQTLGVDPAKALFLGKDANERKVKTADLARYRYIAFATHGLMADDLEGLSQPALALSSPWVAGVDGDGLLTMEEILGLKLNADWVILSACNTAAGAGAGAEAASGLARAFFYAGARALLVTNWSVQSESARELVTDIFRRLAANPKLKRAEALRQAMMALADGPGERDDDKRPLFSYAHPLFWAPYALIGDGN
jgi:CHAT domain-containing protein